MSAAAAERTDADRRVYGPSALATPANAVTLARIATTPVFVALLVRADGPSWAAFGVGFAIGATDFVDGYLARRHGQTRSGAFLDPLADKVLVAGGMITLVALGSFGVVPVAIIVARELAVSGLRSLLGRRGVAVPATRAAKYKTFVQLWAIGFAVMPPVASNAHWVATLTLWVSVVLTLLTGWSYLRAAGELRGGRDFWRAAGRAGGRAEGRAGA